ncbi:DUF6263 family protein [Mucilaginibacter myungsuensis]|uniref:Redoxin domain-containing protein n=1 Tax=Mucilaginibacter myungsuensis TaxID=649104 RepID=A0A929PVV8_9SPHI|nr:DUF6263 family protein [Mucilaginibacter myungsuensis]MBE9660502.1 redoxin domain-containing protein [Mucilaginibacter myungsuensis]MDN3600546.1 DUF6263 family protein [Mucilaginibacter myungsuensis]
MTKLLTLLLAFAAALPAFGQELNVPKGKEFSYTTRVTGSGTRSYDIYNIYNFRSLGKNVNGDNVFECTLIKSANKDNADVKEYDLDTDDLRSAKFNNSGVLNSVAFLHKPFTVIINKYGKIVKMDGLEQIVNDAAVKWGLSAGMKQQLTSHSGTINYNIQQLFFQIPQQYTGAGNNWKTKDGTTYKISPTNISTITSVDLGQEVKQFQEVDKKKNTFIKINYVSGTFTGDRAVYILDAKTGLIQNSLKDRNFNADYSSVKNQVVDKSEQHIGSAGKYAPADTTWSDMAVTLSSFADALKTNGKPDITKLSAYFNANDKRFVTDTYYITQKLRVLGNMYDDDSLAKKIYDSTLFNTPDKYLHARHDNLYTALGSKFAKLSRGGQPQKAYETSKYFFDSEMIKFWLHEATSQTFLFNGENEAIERANNLELLRLMSADNEQGMRAVAKPLYLWASAKKDSTNTELLLQNIAQLNAMDERAMQRGKAGRYALLMYDMLLKRGKQAEAEKFLDITIGKLSKAVEDTLYKDRIQDRSLLAHAYYLKYQAEKTAGRTDALKNLSLAAQFSPSGPADKDRMMMMDRHFLKSKESYRQDLMEHLFALGNEKEALKAFAAHISAEPESLTEMKALYESKFPGKNFKTAFQNDVVASWDTAPEFELKDWKDKDHQLKEYLNKWIVIDFWGTWCGPCQEEAPGINQFNNALSDDPNAAFLSIACKDWPDHVTTFMNKFNYTFPVLMSDNKIEHKFKVDGYPYKVLVSPTGKYITLERGKDWKKILKTFSSI